MSKTIYKITCKRCQIPVESTDKVRQFCSRTCAATFNNTKYPKRIKAPTKLKINTLSNYLNGTWNGCENNGRLSVIVRRYIITKFGNKCTECGWNKINPKTNKVPVQVDHIDGNYQNNLENNLRVLCPNCHSLTPTYGALNLGNGRKYRLSIAQYLKMAPQAGFEPA